MANILSIATGNYSSASSWSGGVVPGLGDMAIARDHRITLDVDTLATLSNTNLDAMAAGAASSTSFTGGFTLPTGSTRIVGDLRYGYGTTSGGIGVGNCLINMVSGSFTCGDMTWVEGTLSGKDAIHLAMAGDCTVTVGDVLVSNATTMASNYAIYVVSSSSATLTVTTGSILANGGNIGSGLLSVSSLAMAFNITTGSLQSGSNSYPAVYIGSGSTGMNNQLLTINQTSPLAYGTTSGIAANVAAVSAITANIPTTITHDSTFIQCTSMRGQATLGDVSVVGSGRALYIISGAGNATVGNITRTITTSHRTSIEATGVNNLTIGSIATTCTGGASFTSTPTVLGGTGNTTIGAISITGNGFEQALGFVTASSGQVTINGDIDQRTVVGTGSLLYFNTPNLRHVTVNGDIYGRNSGGILETTVGAINYLGSGAYGDLTINGNIYAGVMSCGVSVSSTASNVNVSCYECHGAVNESALTESCAGFFSRGVQALIVRGLVCGSLGRFPVSGRVIFDEAHVNTLTGKGTIHNPLTLAAGAGTIPSASDVRSGVAVGSVVGTCVVPAAAYVASGVPVDAGVGTYACAGGLTSGQATSLANIETTTKTTLAMVL